MTTSRIHLATATLILMFSIAALIDAVRTGAVGVAVLTGATSCAALGLIASHRHHQLIALRADLAAWALRTATSTGEAPERLINRCVSSYRAGLGDSHEQSEQAGNRGG